MGGILGWPRRSASWDIPERGSCLVIIRLIFHEDSPLSLDAIQGIGDRQGVVPPGAIEHEHVSVHAWKQVIRHGSTNRTGVIFLD
jgi:hypothetical protein